MAFSSSTRRDFLRSTTVVYGGLAAPALVFAQEKPTFKEKKNEKLKGEEIPPAEDLMREHGGLLSARQSFDGSVLTSAADIIRHFIEEYHEKLEEEFLFPRFRKAGKLLKLVDTLQEQHAAGRRLTAQIRELGGLGTFKYVSDSDKLADALRAFLRMYRPHEAREDTVLFPAFRSVVSGHEYDALGEDFEKKEDELFGQDGFFKVVDQVAQLEKKLGIFELSQFTPK